jgi:hypothetical protein
VHSAFLAPAAIARLFLPEPADRGFQRIRDLGGAPATRRFCSLHIFYAFNYSNLQDQVFQLDRQSPSFSILF